MQYTYAWYQILGMMLAAGLICFVCFRGLDMALEAWLERRRARQLRTDDGA